MQKLHIHKETIYFIAVIIIALSVCLAIASNFGISVLNGPAYVLSQKFNISMSLAEYMVQFILLLIFCLIMRRVRIIYLFTFVTGLIYGGFLRLFQLIPIFNPNLEICQNLSLAVRIIYLILAIILLGFSVSLFGRTYLCPTIYDYFIIAVPRKYHFRQGLFKIIYDLIFLIISLILSYFLIGKITGVGIGTIIFVIFTGPMISLMNKLLDKILYVEAIIPKLETFFEGKNEIREED